MGLFGKDKKKGQASDWIQPVQMTQFGAPGGQPAGPAGAPGQPGGVGPPVPARLRPMTGARHSDWFKGALVLTAGSMLWQPDAGVNAQPVELATATIVPWLPGQGGGGKSAFVTNLETSAGQFQLELDPELFAMSQQLVAEAAMRATPGPGGGQVPPPSPF